MRKATSGIALAIVLALGVAPAATGEPEASARERLELQQRRLEQAAAADAEVRVQWQSDYRALLSAYQAARDRADAAQHEWRSARKRHRLRGDTKVDARDEIEAAEQELAAAMEAIRDFHVRAIAEGALPGWLYDVEAEFPRIASAVAAR